VVEVQQSQCRLLHCFGILAVLPSQAEDGVGKPKAGGVNGEKVGTAVRRDDLPRLVEGLEENLQLSRAVIGSGNQAAGPHVSLPNSTQPYDRRRGVARQYAALRGSKRAGGKQTKIAGDVVVTRFKVYLIADRVDFTPAPP